MSVTIKDYLSHVPNDEITNRLKILDQSLYELHKNGMYVVCNIADIEIINDEVTLASFKNKVDYLDSGYNKNGDKQDILELCSIGVCAFNRFEQFYSSKEFIAYLIDNLEKFINNGKVPRVMQEYYVEIFARGNVTYLNDYLFNNEISKDISSGEGRNNGIVKTKATAVGRALSEKSQESAYVKVLLLPSMIALVYLVVIVVYFIFFR